MGWTMLKQHLGEKTMRPFFFILFTAVCGVSTTCGADGMPAAVRKSLSDNLIGKWNIEFTRGDVVSKGTYVARWSAGRHAVRIDVTQAGEDGTSRASELMGWDADTKSLVVHGFGAESTNWTIRFTDVTSGKWKGTWKGFFNGKVDSSPCTMELRGDSFEYRDTTDGKPLIVRATRK